MSAGLMLIVVGFCRRKEKIIGECGEGTGRAICCAIALRACVRVRLRDSTQIPFPMGKSGKSGENILTSYFWYIFYLIVF
jgi:hypothetical protein